MALDRYSTLPRVFGLQRRHPSEGGHAVPRLLLLVLVVTVSLGPPISRAATGPSISVSSRTEASPNLKRGTLTVRVRALSRRRFVVRVRFRVRVKNPTQVAVFLNPCRRAGRGWRCLQRPLLRPILDLPEGAQDKPYRAVLTRRGRELKRPCVGFNAADQNPDGRRAYNIGPESQPVLCPQLR